MKYTVVLAFTLLIISCEVRPGLPPPRAVNGVLDLRAWDFSDDGNIKLDGKWEFYRSQLLTPTDFERTAPKPTGFIAVPDNWNSFSPSNAPSADQSMGAEGYATYRLEILLPESDDLSLQIISVSSAYKLFINAEYLAGAGVVSQYRSAYRAQKLPQTIQLESEITRVTILIQVANFVDPYGGIWHSIVLGKQRQIAAMQRNNLASDLFLCGSLLIMGLYHLGLFQFRPKERATLYLGLVCPLVALRSLMTGEGYLFQLLPEFSYDWAVRLEYLSFYAGGPLFIMYLRALFPGDFLKLPYYSYIAAGAALSLLTLLTPPHIFGHSLRYMQVITLAACVYAIFSIIHAIIRRRSGAISFSIGILIFAATIINDLLNNQSFVYFQTGSLAPFGLFVFLFSQAYLLSTRFARAFTQVEDLTANLEKKVEVRTRQLSSALQTIQDDIRLARAIQTSTLPRDVGPLEQLEIHSRYIPMTEIGGDYYDIRKLENGIVRVFLADATGHGVQAALMTMPIHAEYISIRDFLLSPDQILTILNNQYCERYSRMNSFFTCIILDIDLSQNRILYSAAGHPEQIIIQSKILHKLYVKNRMIGLKKGHHFNLGERPFFPGDRIFLFTDGIFEEFDSNNEEFGETRLYSLAQAELHRTPEDFCRTILDAVYEFTSGKSITDDITMIAIERKATSENHGRDDQSSIV